MKRFVLLSICGILIFSGCAQRTVADTTQKKPADTYDTVTSVGSGSDSADSAGSSGTAAKASSGSQSMNSAKNSKSSSSQTSSYKIGDKDDPLQSVAPNEVQQYINDEDIIVTEPEPDSVYFDKYSDMDESLKVEPSWFDDCVFIGDSLTCNLSMYNDGYGGFGDAKFVCAGGLGYYNCQWDFGAPGNVHPYFNGKQLLAENAVEVTGANKAIIGLGMNDIGMWGPDGTMVYVKSLVSKIQKNSPGVTIYVQTVSPMLYSRQKYHLNNDLIREFNKNLKEYALSEGIGFLNSYDAFANSDGNLPHEFCSDPEDLGIHLTPQGCSVWREFLRAMVGIAVAGNDDDTPSIKREKPESKTEDYEDSDVDYDSDYESEYEDTDDTDDTYYEDDQTDSDDDYSENGDSDNYDENEYYDYDEYDY